MLTSKRDKRINFLHLAHQAAGESILFRRSVHLSRESSRMSIAAARDDQFLKQIAPIALVRVSRPREKMRYSRFKTRLLKYSFFRLPRNPPRGISTRFTYRVCVHKKCACPAVETIDQAETYLCCGQ